MYFVKLCYQWLLPPGCFIFVLGMISFLALKNNFRWRWLLVGVTMIFYFMSISIGANILVKPLEESIIPPNSISGDVLIMLGNGSIFDVPDIDGKGQMSGTMAKNMLATARLHYMTHLPILISGGSVFTFSGNETDIALRSFQGIGIPSSAIFLENRSRNTVENAYFSHNICEKYGWHRPVVLVVALQALRTKMIFEREFFDEDISIYPTHYRRSINQSEMTMFDFIPNANNLDDSAMAFKEYLGILAILFNLQ